MVTLLVTYTVIALSVTTLLLYLFIIYNGLYVKDINNTVTIEIWPCVGIILIGICWPMFAILVFFGWIFSRRSL